MQLLESPIPPLHAAALWMIICNRPAPHFDNQEKSVKLPSLREVVRKRKCENFDHFFQWNMTLWYPQHILSHCEGSQKWIFNAFNASAIPLSNHLGQSSSGSKEMGILVVG